MRRLWTRTFIGTNAATSRIAEKFHVENFSWARYWWGKEERFKDSWPLRVVSPNGRGEKALRVRGKVDRNQPAIVRALRNAGATVQSLAEIGGGCPDLLVGFRGKNFVMEVKDGDAKPSQRRLTDDEVKWHVNWNGDVRVVTCVEEAVIALSK